MDQKLCSICDSKNVSRTMNQIPYCNSCLEEERDLFLKYEKSRTKFYPEINEIIPNKLFLGNYDQARDLDSLKKHKITHILICGVYMENFFPDSFKYQQLDIEDIIEEDISKCFNKGIEFIENSDIVFVHCHAGVSRSATIVIAYVMFKFKISYQEAYDYVKQRRTNILPNMSFRKHLKQFEKELFSLEG